MTLTSALALIAFVFVMRFLPEFLAWEGWAACGPEDCNVQSWLAAFSGWAAAAVALFTILPLYRQLLEQQKQTAFLLGDSAPVIMLHRDRFGLQTCPTFRIVNWNRRRLEIGYLEIFCDFQIREIAAVTLNGTESRAVVNGRILNAVLIDGWENRSAGPGSKEIEMQFGVGYDQFGDGGKLDGVNVTVRLRGTLNDVPRQPVCLELELPLRQIASP
ncbi:hypothetical protein CN172_29515 [Sinorhizobium meliloti]|uniref:hypothetical protein n=1 Tax=Rhizobium meliloti TaxID=382 RepID=UPI000FDB794E|nr:hypothetical protein [Sinorhizobium meliloti]RVF00022.1 hypothetical protein CN232_15315 [Sinorhizobium meliloti]RVH39915.1 hypothetical protein CN208_26700 [Sinorhizobium meliloti]RVK06010.1 hypothetical protein CN172_29515 [Sinorhizobium meliloti]